MSYRRDCSPVELAIEQCEQTQCMIDITATKLQGLRGIEGDIIEREICEAESKLVKLFSKQLVAKARLKLTEIPEKLREFPKIEQWLQIVGINQQACKGVIQRTTYLESLLEMSEAEVARLLARFHSLPEEITRLNTALRNLKAWTDRQLQVDKGPGMVDLDLHWSVYKSANNSPHGGNSPKFGHHQRPSTSSLPPDTYLNAQSPTSPPSPPHSTPASPIPYPASSERRPYTPPATPPLVKPSKGKFPTTPPPQKRNKLYPDAFHPLFKSKSHESQLSTRVNQDAEVARQTKKKPVKLTIADGYDTLNNQRKRSADGSDQGYGSVGLSGQMSPLVSSPKRSPPYKHVDQNSLPEFYDVHPNKKNQLVVPPVSPNTPLGTRSMMHSIRHKLTNTFKITTCDLCQKQMFLGFRCRGCKFHTSFMRGVCDACHKKLILGRVCKKCRFQNKLVVGSCDICHKHVFRGKVCKYCKMKFHRDCATKAAPACGLPNELVDVYLDTLRLDGGSPRSLHHVGSLSLPAGEHMIHANSIHSFQTPESSSNTSSCTSSTSSSPALFIRNHQSPSSSAHPSPQIHITSHSQFQFPDVSLDSSGIGTLDSFGTTSSLTLDSQYFPDRSDIVNTNTSNDSDKSDRTLIDTGSSSERAPPIDRVDSQESTEEGLSQSWHRVNSISVTLKEWDIPYEQLVIGEKIGMGRVGTVFKGNWHGDVAIKMIHMDPDVDNQAQLQAFKLEVAMLRKTRHENLVLFMGACMKPPHLAIVASLCKGQTLFTLIHSRKEKFAMNRTVRIASQIAQGMGYLHAKGIVHKDLKSKNIFLENGKVVITDFGLFSVTKICHGHRKGAWLSIPSGWLCYLSPEIMRSLQAGNQQNMDLPFTQSSDVYAFGTVWYELLCSEWPFKNQPPEAIIWQVGKGMKQALGQVQASRDVKDVLMLCWTYSANDRPDFSKLLKLLEKLPKKRLARSPSHPIQLSRSAESVF